MRDATCVGSEGYAGVVAGDVLGEKLAALGKAAGAAECLWVPDCGNEHAVVWAWNDLDVSDSGVPNLSAVACKLDVHVGDGCRIIGGVGDI